jgi:hypothetical protein
MAIREKELYFVLLYKVGQKGNFFLFVRIQLQQLKISFPWIDLPPLSLWQRVSVH